MIYLVNWLQLATANLKKELRKTTHLKWLEALLKPLTDLNATFASKADQLVYKTSFNGQTIYLEHYLNDIHDPVMRRIYIENTATSNAKYIFNKAEVQTPVYVYNKSEGMAPLYLYGVTEPVSSVHFIVWVPDDITFTEINMRAEVDQYRIAGRIYQIQTFAA